MGATSVRNMPAAGFHLYDDRNGAHEQDGDLKKAIILSPWRRRSFHDERSRPLAGSLEVGACRRKWWRDPAACILVQRISGQTVVGKYTFAACKLF